MVSEHLAQFGVQRSCASGDIMHLICHVTSQDNLIERSYGLVGESSSQCVTTLASLVTTDILRVEMFLICHITLRDHNFEGLCFFKGGSPSVTDYPAKFSDNTHCGRGDIMVLVCHVI